MAIVVSDKDLTAIVNDQVQSETPTKLSDLENDAGYVTTTGHVAHAKTANAATNLTGASGVTAGTYGPSASVSITTGQTKSINIPYFTVNSAGIVTYMTQRTLKVTSGCNNCSNCGQCNNYSGCSQCSTCNNCGYRCPDCSHHSCYNFN